MTERDDIIPDGTDGLGETTAGSGSFSGRTKSDPADAETDSGSTSEPPASSEAGGDAESSSTSQTDPAEQISEEIDELARALAERDEYKDLALRAKADFENYRKRADKRVGETQATAIAGVVRELLPVVDNLDRAVEVAGGSGGGEAFAEGVRLVHSDLHAVLDRLGLVPIDPAGEQFDPNFHEAISQTPADGVAANTILEVAQRGFALGETVVRPARVVVAA